MARIREFRKGEQTHGQTHPTDVECVWWVFESEMGRLLQLDTFGSSERRNPGQQSQTLQLDRDRAEELVEILTQQFQFRSWRTGLDSDSHA